MIDAPLRRLGQSGAWWQCAEIDQIASASKLIDADVLDDPFHAEPECVDVKAQAALYIRNSQNSMIDPIEFQGTCRHDGPPSFFTPARSLRRLSTGTRVSLYLSATINCLAHPASYGTESLSLTRRCLYFHSPLSFTYSSLYWSASHLACWLSRNLKGPMKYHSPVARSP